MPDRPSVSRRMFIRGAAVAVPVLGAALAAPALTAPGLGPLHTTPRAGADPVDGDQCADPAALIDGCVVQLPEEFTSTSFSTTAVAAGTNYSVLFSTKIPAGPHVPPGASGYRIRSVSLTGQKRDGSPFAVTPHIGEAGPRVLGARSASSLGFVVDVPWNASALVREFTYNFDVVYLAGLTEIKTCPYVTTMTLADNGLIVGGVGSVRFAPPQSTACTG